jgi:hypothetical protein
MISDYWKGLAVYRSDDFTHWIRCADILNESGRRPMDKGWGHHADVVVRGERAFLFYFCHPFACEDNEKGKELSGLTEADRSKAVVQAAELTIRNGELYCDRNAQVTWPQ